MFGKRKLVSSTLNIGHTSYPLHKEWACPYKFVQAFGYTCTTRKQQKQRPPSKHVMTHPYPWIGTPLLKFLVIANHSILRIFLLLPTANILKLNHIQKNNVPVSLLQWQIIVYWSLPSFQFFGLSVPVSTTESTLDTFCPYYVIVMTSF